MGIRDSGRERKRERESLFLYLSVHKPSCHILVYLYSFIVSQTNRIFFTRDFTFKKNERTNLLKKTSGGKFLGVRENEAKNADISRGTVRTRIDELLLSKRNFPQANEMEWS